MAGSDVPPGGSGAPPGSPVTPEQPRKRKSGAADADKGAAPGSGSARRLTRSSALALFDVDVAVAWTLRAARGRLWAVRGRNRGIVDEDRLMAVMLALRHTRFKEVDPEHPDPPYPKKQKRLHKGTRSSERIAAGRIAGERIPDEPIQLPNFLAKVATRKNVQIHPDTYQAAVPEWVNAPPEEDNADYINDKVTLQKMGTVVSLPPLVEPRKTRNTVDNKCKCSHPGSEACVGVHVKEASKRVKHQLGEQAFKNCGFDDMGEQVLKQWTRKDMDILADIEKSVPQNKNEDFMKIALKQFSSERTKDLAKYYYNVFLPRRLASLNRAEALDEGNNQDDEGNNQDDGKNAHQSKEKCKGSGSSLKRSSK